MRLLLDDGATDPGATDDPDLLAGLAALYAYPEDRTWLRANMVSTVDGAATGPDGRTGTINNEADKRVFDLLRALADVVVVGAGTARAEGYRRIRPPAGELGDLREGRAPAPTLVVVSRSGNLPLQLAGPPEHADDGDVVLVTCMAAPEEAITTAREALGEENVLVGGDEVDLLGMVAFLEHRGLTRILTEGGPQLLRDMVAAGVVDELCLTVVPQLLAGDHPRILAGEQLTGGFRPRLLLEEDGTLLGRWQRA